MLPERYNHFFPIWKLFSKGKPKVLCVCITQIVIQLPSQNEYKSNVLQSKEDLVLYSVSNSNQSDHKSKHPSDTTYNIKSAPTLTELSKLRQNK